MIRPVLTTLPHEPAHTTTRSTALPRYAAMHPKPLFTFPTLLLRINIPKGYWTESSDLSQMATRNLSDCGQALRVADACRSMGEKQRILRPCS
jgi:hypothetical protein